MRQWGFNPWLKHQGHLGWSRLRIAEQEGRIASWQDGAPPSSPAADGVHLDELLSRLKSLYQENDALARQRDDWQAERERLENALAAERQRIEEARAEVASHQTLVEQQRAELQLEREGLSHALEHLKQEMLDLRQSLADHRAQPDFAVQPQVETEPQDESRAQAHDEPESPHAPTLHDREPNPAVAGESDGNAPMEAVASVVGEIGDIASERDLNDEDDYEDDLGDGYVAALDDEDDYEGDLDDNCVDGLDEDYEDDLDHGYDDEYDESDVRESGRRASFEYEEGEISITERLIRFGIEKKRRPVWAWGSAWLVGAALAASCSVAVWASFDSIKFWLSF